VAGLVALVFLAAGGMKLIRPKDKLASGGMGWVERIPGGLVKVLALLEVLGAIGVILPALVGIAPILVPVAAAGLAVVMVGAMVVHLRAKEFSQIGINLVLFALAAFVVVGRFWLVPFA
jgi:hypothetical protein